MKVTETPLPGVLLIEPVAFGDPRGFFVETHHDKRYREAGIDVDFVQDNHSRSRQGVLRGLHYQLAHPQGKLVRVALGTVLDVAVDIRKGSPTFGHTYSTILSDENHRQLYIPPDFAHGFCVLSEVADFIYKCTDYYYPEDQWGIAWNDPDLEIDWQLRDVLLSDKDQQNPRLRDCAPDTLPSYAAGGDPATNKGNPS